MRLTLFALFLLAALLPFGCAGGGVGSNQADFIKALAVDPASNCVVVNTPYGGLLVARGTPGAKVTLAGGSCSIDAITATPATGGVSTNIQVPVKVTPAIDVGAPTVTQQPNVLPAPPR